MIILFLDESTSKPYRVQSRANRVPVNSVSTLSTKPYLMQYPKPHKQSDMPDSLIQIPATIHTCLCNQIIVSIKVLGAQKRIGSGSHGHFPVLRPTHPSDRSVDRSRDWYRCAGNCKWTALWSPIVCVFVCCVCVIVFAEWVRGNGVVMAS